MNTVAKAVVERYAEREGIHLCDVADRLLMSKSSLSLKLQGKRGWSLEEAFQLSQLLGIPLDALAKVIL